MERFFSKAQIGGIDIRKVSKNFEEPRISVEIGDASKPRFLNRIFREYQPSVIVDDASHFWSHQIIGFETLFLQLPPHGIYIVEDIQTSFLRNEEGNSYADHSESFWSYISRLQAALACGQNHGPELTAKEAEIVSEIDTILLSRETVAIIKREAPREVESEIASKKRRQARRAKAKELAAQ